MKMFYFSKYFIVTCLFIFFSSYFIFSLGEKNGNRIKIALGSCNRQYGSQLFWKNIIHEKPDLFLMLGDNVYSDTSDMRVRKKAFDVLFSNKDFLKLWNITRVEAIWDDHDFSRDDIAGANYPEREAAQKTFLDAFRVPADSSRRQHPGIYYSWIEGQPGKRLQVIMLDTRYFKTQELTQLPTAAERLRGIVGKHPPSLDPLATMLGETQWQWLKGELLKPAEIRMIASSSEVIPNERRTEYWGNFPLERKKLFDLIQKTQAAGVFFISGDSHFSEISMTTEGSYPLYDFTSSSFNQANQIRAKALNSLRLPGKLYAKPNFGTIEIDWSKADPEIRMMTHSSENGGDGFVQIIKLSELQFKSKRIAGLIDS